MPKNKKKIILELERTYESQQLDTMCGPCLEQNSNQLMVKIFLSNWRNLLSGNKIYIKKLI
jgi:hypothetical protein